MDTPSVVNMWSLCTSLLPGPSVRLIDFIKSFHILFNLDHPGPGTPLRLSAPELILCFPSEIATSIDIWAFVCTSWELLGRDSLFYTGFNSRAEILADMIFLLRGKGRENILEQFWNLFREKLGRALVRSEWWAVSGRAEGWMLEERLGVP